MDNSNILITFSFNYGKPLFHHVLFGASMRFSNSRDLVLPDSMAAFLSDIFPAKAFLAGCSPLEGDASDRKYYRLLVESPRGGSLEPYILMQLASPWSPDTLGTELPFVNVARHLAAKGIPVPRICEDASKKGFVLLEDVGDVTLQAYLQGCSPGDKLGCYREAVEILVQMQLEASQVSDRPCVALTYGFDTETFFGELCFFYEHALEGLWGHRIPGSDARELDEHFWNLCEEISAYPQSFTHRDYHSRNLMVHAGRLVVLDFQDARMGPDTYDLASLIRDSYVSLEPEEQQELLDYYQELRIAAGMPVIARDEFNEAYGRTGIQRNLKAIGTFAYQAVVKGVDRYLPCIPNTVASVRAALEKDPELNSFRRILEVYLGPS